MQYETSTLRILERPGMRHERSIWGTDSPHGFATVGFVG
jgi:hypothetical protein